MKLKNLLASRKILQFGEKSRKTLKFLFSAIFLFNAGFLFPADLTVNEEKALAYLRDFCFEITRYNITGFSSSVESAAFSEISKIGSALMAQLKITDSAKNPVYLCEYYMPEKIGIIDCTFRPEDLYVTSDFFEGIENVEEGEEEEIEQPDWIDQIFLSLNAPSHGQNPSGESFSILDGEKILEMLEGGDDRGIEEKEEDKVEKEAPKEISYTKNDGSLRRFSYDGEQFTVFPEGENTVIVNYYGDKLVRKSFDPLFRLVKDENFKTGTTAKKMSLESEIDYEYFGETNLPVRSVENKVAAKKRIENEFDSGGRVVSLLESHYVEREIKSKKKKKNSEAEKETVLLKDKKVSRVYDEKGRITEEEITTWNYKTNTFGRNLTEERSVKNVYDYSSVTESNNLPPNVKFFEDGELHLERKYTSPANYSETLYFEGGFSVELLYENGIKTTEIIAIDGVERRRREFEH